MDKKELEKKYEEQDRAGKALMLEKLAFCKFADRHDFDNYFRIGELMESELLCLVSFLYHHDCFLMIGDIINQYREKFIVMDTFFLRELEPDNGLTGRLSRIGILPEA